QSRVGASPSYVGVAPSAETRRARAPDASAARTQAVPRVGPASGAVTATRVGPPPEANPRAGTTGPAPRAAGPIEHSPSRTAVPREDRPEGMPSRGPRAVGGATQASQPAPVMPERAPVVRGTPEPGPGVRAMPRSYDPAPPPTVSRPPS